MGKSSLDSGLIGNCQIAALVSPLARIEWACFPRFDGDPAFCSLLSETATRPAEFGYFDVELLGFERAEQRYLHNTAILETLLHDDAGGCVRVLDFAPRYHQFGRSFRPAMLVRILECVEGNPTIRTRLRPAVDYGRRPAPTTHGSHHVRYETGEFTLRLTTDGSLSSVLEGRAVLLRERLTFLLGPDETIPDSPDRIGRDMLEQTKRYWQSWVRGLSIPVDWQRQVIRAAITLKLCAFEDSGAIIAAPTTSIPEAADSGRNWDYRFCWLRDSYYVVNALNRLGATKTMQDYLGYLVDLVSDLDEDAELQPLFGITGRSELTERIVEHLPGYRGMGPVRVGNQAYEQTQNDSYGAIVLAATRHFFDERLPQRGGLQEFRTLERIGRRAVEVSDRPDAGIWEFRGRERVHTYSVVMCWAACDRLAKIAEHLGLEAESESWREHAERIHATVCESAWDAEQNAFVESFGGTNLDASLLTIADLGFVRSDDPRFVGTVEAIGRTLVRGDYVFRYAEADDFGAPENAFNICTFWYVCALATIGREDEARTMFCNMLERLNPLGLLSEDLDPANGELWGNFPQTYSMVGIINAATRLSRTWEETL